MLTVQSGEDFRAAAMLSRRRNKSSKTVAGPVTPTVPTPKKWANNCNSYALRHNHRGTLIRSWCSNTRHSGGDMGIVCIDPRTPGLVGKWMCSQSCVHNAKSNYLVLRENEKLLGSA